MIGRPPYAYREDPSVPPFPDDRPIIVYDGMCRLCAGSVRLALTREPEARFLAAQSDLAQALYRHFGLNAVDLDSWLLIEDGRCFVKADAAARLMARWRWPWRLLAAAIRATPRRLREWTYERVARNRYALFGRRSQCVVPSPEVRARFIAWE